MTKEEIALEHAYMLSDNYPRWHGPNVYTAMQEYSDQETEKYRDKIILQEAEISALKAALKELVVLNGIKKKYEEPCNLSRRDSNLIQDYLRRKPLAWEAARKLLNT